MIGEIISHHKRSKLTDHQTEARELPKEQSNPRRNRPSSKLSRRTDRQQQQEEHEQKNHKRWKKAKA
ncbi:hypothetical protein BRADI_3g18285v3 [Brachypodium distachyon]|uniref:Uncharacterized protein n=1 Tax=Brachypodium distachyon TaxID=15368 RepID=A0A0Q3Q1X9_BRADI|nr:hypothetical protein BRADI_3g18285v3 [Brachypodium distachyon]